MICFSFFPTSPTSHTSETLSPTNFAPTPVTYVTEPICWLSMSKSFFLLISHDSLNCHLFKYDLIIRPSLTSLFTVVKTSILIFLLTLCIFIILVSNWCNIKCTCVFITCLLPLKCTPH